MSDEKVHFYGKVDEEGKLKIARRTDFDQSLLNFKGKEIEGFYWKKRKRRSLPQNAYLWACIYPILVQGFKDMGHENVTINDVHEWAKEKFRDEEDEKQIVSTLTGEVIRIRNTTTKFTTTRMMGYIASIKKWAAEFLGINIPDPTPLFGIE